MPGFLPHFIVGNILFFIGWQYTSTLLKKDFTRNEYLLLYVVCLFGSVIPDFPLGLYYLFNVGSFDSLIMYHIFLHLIISPLAVGVFIILNIIGNVRKKPIWIFGVFSVIIHVLMDAMIEEMGVWI